MSATITEKLFTVTYSARTYGATNFLERQYKSGTSEVYANSRDEARSMVESDLFERGWVLQAAAINQVRPIVLHTAYESLTLHNICDSVAGWKARQAFDGLGRDHELYWLDKLESFFNAI